MDDGDKQFISQEVLKILEDAINTLFAIKEQVADADVKAIYHKQKANQSINSLIDYTIRGLCKLNKPFKYAATGVLMQKTGAALNTCSLAFNDPNTDGAVTLQREIGDNVIVLTVFAMQV